MTEKPKTATEIIEESQKTIEDVRRQVKIYRQELELFKLCDWTGLVPKKKKTQGLGVCDDSSIIAKQTPTTHQYASKLTQP